MVGCDDGRVRPLPPVCERRRVKPLPPQSCPIAMMRVPKTKSKVKPVKKKCCAKLRLTVSDKGGRQEVPEGLEEEEEGT